MPVFSVTVFICVSSDIASSSPALMGDFTCSNATTSRPLLLWAALKSYIGAPTPVFTRSLLLPPEYTCRRSSL